MWRKLERLSPYSSGRASSQASRSGSPPPPPKLITGAELTLSGGRRISLLARDRAAYGLLCRMITATHAVRLRGSEPSAPASEAVLEWAEFLRLIFMYAKMHTVRTMPWP